MYGLVLAGGGARGAYEVGAWRGVQELGIEIGAICGTSIGSINGAVFAQGDGETAEKLWREISAADILDMTGLSDEKLFSLKNIGAVFEEFKKNKGLSMAPLEELLRNIVNEDKLMLSPVDFGLVTYSLTDFAETEIFKADIPRGKLVDYLMASACLPGIKTKVIDDKAFVDGFVADNKPISMLVKKGYRDIISVDVGGFGIVKHVPPEGVNIINIRCASPMVGVLEFDSNRIADSIQTGYLDTKRAFGVISGSKYAIRTADYNRTKKRISQELLDGLEFAAELLGVDMLKEYSVTSLARAVMKEYRRLLKENTTLSIESILNAKDKNSAILLAKAAEAVSGGNGELLTGRFVSSVFKGIARAVNAVLYFSDKV